MLNRRGTMDCDIESAPSISPYCIPHAYVAVGMVPATCDRAK